MRHLVSELSYAALLGLLGLSIGCGSDSVSKPTPEPECVSSTGAGCTVGEVCVDDATDACDPGSQPDCGGSCESAVLPPSCAGLGTIKPCPAGFACMDDPRNYLGTDPSGICVGEEFTGQCSFDPPDPCPEHFVCLGGQLPVDGPGDCAPDGVDCSGTISCLRAEPPACPGGYLRSVVDGCFGPCVPADTCTCTGNVECAGGAAVCDRELGRCMTLG